LLFEQHLPERNSHSINRLVPPRLLLQGRARSCPTWQQALAACHEVLGSHTPLQIDCRFEVISDGLA
jgi:hypothetical protein